MISHFLLTNLIKINLSKRTWTPFFRLGTKMHKEPS